MKNPASPNYTVNTIAKKKLSLKLTILKHYGFLGRRPSGRVSFSLVGTQLAKVNRRQPPSSDPEIMHATGRRSAGVTGDCGGQDRVPGPPKGRPWPPIPKDRQPEGETNAVDHREEGVCQSRASPFLPLGNPHQIGARQKERSCWEGVGGYFFVNGVSQSNCM